VQCDPRSDPLSPAINLKYILDKSKLHIATRRASASHRGTTLSTRNQGKKGIPVSRRGGPNRHVPLMHDYDNTPGVPFSVYPDGGSRGAQGSLYIRAAANDLDRLILSAIAGMRGRECIDRRRWIRRSRAPDATGCGNNASIRRAGGGGRGTGDGGGGRRRERNGERRNTLNHERAH